jgi:alpha-amylase
LRGGFWRNFLIRYPEVNDNYRKMLRVSRRLAAALAPRPDDPALLGVRAALWRGQCNDAYWHGIFGGVYLPHLRRAIRSALLTAEAGLDRYEGAGSTVTHEIGDFDGDGASEIVVRSDRLSLLVRPAAGGTLTELAYRPLAFDLADVLTRRPESAHLRVAEAEQAQQAGAEVRTIHDHWLVKEPGLARLLTYDAHRRASLQDYLLPPEVSVPADLERAGVAFPGQRYGAAVDSRRNGVAIVLQTEGHLAETQVGLTKTIEVRGGADTVGVDYELRASRLLAAGFAVRWNLTLTGPSGGRYVRTEEGSAASLEEPGDREGSRLELVDDWLGLTARLEWRPRARVTWAPVYTVSLSESGLERVWQGLEVVVLWPVALGPERWSGHIELTLQPHKG